MVCNPRIHQPRTRVTGGHAFYARVAASGATQRLRVLALSPQHQLGRTVRAKNFAARLRRPQPRPATLSPATGDTRTRTIVNGIQHKGLVWRLQRRTSVQRRLCHHHHHRHHLLGYHRHRHSRSNLWLSVVQIVWARQGSVAMILLTTHRTATAHVCHSSAAGFLTQQPAFSCRTNPRNRGVAAASP